MDEGSVEFDSQRRRQNRAVIQEWIQGLFWDPGQEARVSDDGGLLRFMFPPDRRPETSTVKLTTAMRDLDGAFEEWIESPIEVFDTDDPTHFLIYFRLGYGRPTKGGGLPHESEFIVLYIVEEGLIKEIREYFNPLQYFNAMNQRVPGTMLLEDELPEAPFM